MVGRPSEAEDLDSESVVRRLGGGGDLITLRAIEPRPTTRLFGVMHTIIQFFVFITTGHPSTCDAMVTLIGRLTGRRDK